MRIRALLALLLAALLAAGLSACGGGGSSTSSTTTTTASAPAAAAAPKAPAPVAAAKAPAAGPRPKANPSPAADPAYAHARAKAGAAANFVVRKGDNSIPTYGSQASSSAQALATAALAAYLSARASGDWAAACSHMAGTVQKQLELLAGAQGKGGGCATAYAKLSERASASERADPLSGAIAAFRVNGDRAFALFYGPHEQQYMMPMVSEGGAWKVNQIEPIPWPVGAPTASS